MGLLHVCAYSLTKQTVENNPSAQSTSIMYHLAQSTVYIMSPFTGFLHIVSLQEDSFMSRNYVRLCDASCTCVRASQFSGTCTCRLSSRFSLLYAVISVLSVIYFFIYALETTDN